MYTNSLKLATAFLIGSIGAASADVIMVRCIDEKVTISMSEEIAILAQERAGSDAKFEQNVCLAAQQLPLSDYKDATLVTIMLMPSEITTNITVFPMMDDTGN